MGVGLKPMATAVFWLGRALPGLASSGLVERIRHARQHRPPQWRGG